MALRTTKAGKVFVPNGPKHEAAVAAYRANHGPEARIHNAAERQAVRDTLSPADQLAELDRRLGDGIGAKGERARLLKQIMDDLDRKAYVEPLGSQDDYGPSDHDPSADFPPVMSDYDLYDYLRDADDFGRIY